ncbi:MAG: response regulator transcription factor [Saprospiraceae bacterium]|nr:response regulator transcription factor [Saprospiraceae bacterium]
MTYTCMIVDDEPLAHRILEKYLLHTEGVVLKYTAFNAKDAALFLSQNTIDILLLDINMPEINGIDFLKSLDSKPITIFTTAYRNHALEGYELGVLDYLLKPIKQERFDLAMHRAIEFLRLKALEEQLEENEQTDIVIRSNGKNICLAMENISHIQGLKDYTIIFTPEKKYVVKGSIKAMMERLPVSQFVRVHKSFIVAKSKLLIVNRNKIEFDGFQIPIGRRFKEKI